VPTILIDSVKLVHDCGDKFSVTIVHDCGDKFSVTTLCSNGVREREMTKKGGKKCLRGNQLNP
jgi:hypothetical protein